jgi:general secretion pathway protein G
MVRSKQAFTLIEILCVLLIMAILAAIAISLIAYAKTQALRSRTHSQLSQINGMIVEYKVKNGRIPMTLSNVVSTLPEGLVYSNGLPLDPWGRQYQYLVSGESYRIFSMGPDKATGTATNSGDDIEFKK